MDLDSCRERSSAATMTSLTFTNKHGKLSKLGLFFAVRLGSCNSNRLAFLNQWCHLPGRHLLCMGFLSEHVCAVLLVSVWQFRRRGNSCLILAEANTTPALCKDDALGPTAIRRVQSLLYPTGESSSGWAVLLQQDTSSQSSPCHRQSWENALPQPRSLPGCCHLTEGLALAETGLGITDQLQVRADFRWTEKEKGEERDMLHPHQGASVLICISRWPYRSFWCLWNLYERDSSPRTNNTQHLKTQIPLTLPSWVL